MSRNTRNSWISRMIIPCDGIDRCEYYKPGETNHPKEHMISKVIYENECSSSTVNSNEKYLQAGTFLDNLAPIPYDPMLDPPKLSACFNCWYLNHSTRECFSKKKFIYCSNCGRRNVEVEDCPRCSKAYYEYIEEEEHIRAKIELYGDEQMCPNVSSNFYKTKGEDDLKPMKNEKNFQSVSASFGKEGEFRSGSFFKTDLETSFNTNEESYSACASDRDSIFDNRYRKDYATTSISNLKNHKSHNQDDKNQLRQEVLFANGKCAYPVCAIDQSCRYQVKYNNEFSIVNDIKNMSLSTKDKCKDKILSADKKKSKTEDEVSSDYLEVTSVQESKIIQPTTKYNKIEPQPCPSSCQIDASKNSFGECFGLEVIDKNETESESLNKPVQKKVTFDTSSVPSRFVDEEEEEEDYEDIIIDEDEKSVIASECSDSVSRFMDLLDNIKHLPIEAQNIAVNCFVNSQKKQRQT